MVNQRSGAPALSDIPDATVARLPLYQRALIRLRDDKAVTVSSEELAQLTALNGAKVRKDLSYLGSYGVRGGLRR